MKFSSYRHNIHFRKINFFFFLFSLPYVVAEKRHSYKCLKTTVVFGLYYSSNVSMTTTRGSKYEEEDTSAGTISQVKDTCKILHLGWNKSI